MTGGDHLLETDDSTTGDGLGLRGATTAAGRPEAGSGRGTSSTGVGVARRHGSTIKPCWASAPPPTSNMPNTTLTNGRRPTASQYSRGGQSGQ